LSDNSRKISRFIQKKKYRAHASKIQFSLMPVFLFQLKGLILCYLQLCHQTSASEAILTISMRKISVCMATYNGARFIDEQISSVLAQLNPTDELIISDDGSTDDTLKKIRAWNDPRIVVLANSGKRGAVRWSSMILCCQMRRWWMRREMCSTRHFSE